MIPTFWADIITFTCFVGTVFLMWLTERDLLKTHRKLKALNDLFRSTPDKKKGKK